MLFSSNLNYEAFKALWEQLLTESRVRVATFSEETMDMRSMARSYKVHVEPLNREDSAPFHVSAALSWQWSAIQSSRTHTCDNDALYEVLGRHSKLRTGKPWLRVAIELHATLPYEKPMAMPSKKAWNAWTTETMSRLDNIERLIPEKQTKPVKGGRAEILAWKGSPKAEVDCTEDGELMLTGVKMSAWQAIILPRVLDGGDRPGAGPEKQLERMFKRVATSLSAWSEVMDHLRA